MATRRTILRNGLIAGWLALCLGVACFATAETTNAVKKFDWGDPVSALDGSAHVIPPDAVTRVPATKQKRASSSPPQWPNDELTGPVEAAQPSPVDGC